MIRKFIIIITVLLISIQANSQTTIQHSDTTEYYSFEINYWFNMHNFLWLESFLRKEFDSTMVDFKLKKKTSADLDAAIEYYHLGLVDEDLRMSDYMTSFKEWITSNPDKSDVPDSLQEHFEVLQKFSGTYENVFWPKHRQSCETALNENIDLIRKFESEFVDRLSQLTRQFWQEGRVKVDIVYVAKASKWNLRNRPYTSIFPTHVVMNAYGDNDVPGNWLELLFHESAHNMILTRDYFVGGTIMDVASVMKVKPPRQLWHAYLFYFTGYLAKDMLEKAGIDYPETYMKRNKVFGRYHNLLDRHLIPYINREITLATATERFITELNQ